MRKVFLEELPHSKSGKQILWRKSIGYKVNFIYDDIQGELEIIGYKNSHLVVKYKNKDTYTISANSFNKCNLGNILGKRMKDFRIEIGTIFKDDKRDLIILNKEYRIRKEKNKTSHNEKWYKYCCNKCGNEDWALESGLITQKQGCNACRISPGNIVLGINTIYDKATWMIPFLENKDDAEKYSPQSNKKVKMKCPKCGKIKDKLMSPNVLYHQHSIGCNYCSDGVKYPNKFSYSLLKQLNVTYKFEYLEHEYSPDWIKPKRYDNYFIHNGKQYILEMDGGFHYKDNTLSGQTKEESKEIDDYKDKLAKEHDIEVIRIDCNYNTDNRFEYIKNNIFKSDFKNIFNLNKIDWDKVEEFALSNLVKMACDYKRNNPNLTTTEIGKIMKLEKSTIRKYLKQGSGIWCNYNPKEESIRSSNKSIVCVETGQIFESAKKCVEKSEEIFGVKLLSSGISKSIIENRKYKGYSFTYTIKDRIDEIEK